MNIDVDIDELDTLIHGLECAIQESFVDDSAKHLVERLKKALEDEWNASIPKQQ